ncbi:MAG: RusA family crossover junction endodeoxyribonuclease [Pseudomonadota bacterium]
MTLRIEIPGEPTAWARAGQNGRFKFTPRPQAVAMDVVRMAANRVMAGQNVLTGPLHVSAKFIYAWPASWSQTKRSKAGAHWKTSRPDGDNLLKLVADALNGLVWTDDAIIASATIQKQYGVKPFTLIEIESLTPRPAGCGAQPEAATGLVVSGTI